MPDPGESPLRSGEHVNPRWTQEREERVRARLAQGIARRRATRVLFSLGTAAAVAVIGVFALGRGLLEQEAGRSSRVEGRHDPMAVLLSLDDGSLVTRVSNAARVTPLQVGPGETLMRLESGEARFSVTPNPKRRFRVLAGNSAVTVLGTEFRVALLPTGVEVVVDHGRVEVACPDGHHVLQASERWLCGNAQTSEPAANSEPELAPNSELELDAEPELVPNSELESAPEPELVPNSELESAPEPEPNSNSDSTPALALEPKPTLNPQPSAPHAEPTKLVDVPVAPSQPDALRGGEEATRAQEAPSWRTLAREGDYPGAYARMSSEGPNTVRDEPADLLFAADVLRLSGHAEAALERLERVLSAHGKDARAPLAAFTLGRTLDELGRRREAASAFARVRQLAPASALAEDALAREVESLAGAGEAELARERAREYLDQYPKGLRRKSVRHLVGLE